MHKGALPRRRRPKERCSPMRRVRLRSGVIAPATERRGTVDVIGAREVLEDRDRDRDLHRPAAEGLDDRRERPDAHGTGAREERRDRGTP